MYQPLVVINNFLELTRKCRCIPSHNLPGRSGPAYDGKGGRRGMMGELGNNRPEKTAFLHERFPPVAGRAQGMTVVEPQDQNTKELNEQQIDLKQDPEQIHSIFQCKKNCFCINTRSRTNT